MTRQGKTRGHKRQATSVGASDTLRVPGGAPVGPDQMAAARADAARYLVRTGNADLLEVLGLEHERPELGPVVVVRGVTLCSTCRMRVKADGVCRRLQCPAGARNQAGQPPGPVRQGYCPLCNNPMPRSGVCRKRLVCREAAARAEMETQ